MKRVVLSSAVFVAFAVLMGCGTKNKPPASKLTITPTTASVVTGQVLQFTATSTDNPTPAVNWYVNDVSLGDRTVGIIDYSGRYIAPGTVPNPAKVTVKAVLATDTTQTASAAVTITAGTPVAITLTPTENVSVPAGQTQQFTATVSNTADTIVAWSVVDPSGNNIPGGNAVYGTIDQYGMYSAPATVPKDKDGNTIPVTIKATAAADTTKSATVTVTIKPFTYISVTPSVVPALAAGGTQQFTANRNGQPVDVTWGVQCNSQAEGACGSIESTGLYTAPLSPPPGADVNITATSADPDDHAGGAIVTVQFSNASLTGKYALSFSGKNADGPYSAAGSVSFDGGAHITAGELDINNGSLSNVTVTGGSYNIGTDGRGVLNIETPGGTLTWRVVLANHSQGYVNSGRERPTGIGSGTLELQDSGAFGVASMNGAYAISVAGPDAHNAASFAMAGAISADGAGRVTSGVLDVNNAGDVQSSLAVTAGSYTAPSGDGRGTITVTSSFGTQTYVYYIVDANHARLLSADARAAGGNLIKQATGPFSTASWQGGFALVLAGSKTGQPLGEGGVLQLNGAGVITAGTMDINDNGNVTPAQGIAVTGTYEIADAAMGRTTVTLTVNGAAMHYVLYPRMDGLNLMGVDTTEVTSGVALAQDETNYGAGTIAGTYALSLAGADLTGNPGEEGVLGQIIPNGATAITGVLDINDNGSISTSNGLQGAEYHAASSGRFSATLPTSSPAFTTAGFNVYAVDRNRALWLENDSNRVLTGTMQKQY